MDFENPKKKQEDHNQEIGLDASTEEIAKSHEATQSEHANEEEYQIKKRKEAIEMRKRIDNLRESDTPYADSVEELAYKENEFREGYKRDLEETYGSARPKLVEKYADKYSTGVLLEAEAKSDSWKDSLTGLRNKSALEFEVPKMISFEIREGHSYSILVTDLDDFKKINDIYGHLAGDKAIKNFATVTKNGLRESDMVYRFGGEEFVILLMDTNLREAKIVAEKIRSMLEKNSLKILDNDGKERLIKFTTSIGVVGSNQMKNRVNKTPKEIMKEMIRMADQAQYQAKKEGKNKVVAYEGEERKDEKGRESASV